MRPHRRFVRAGLSLVLIARVAVTSVMGLERAAAQMACCAWLAHECGSVAPDCCEGQGPQLRKLRAAARAVAPLAPVTSFVVLPLSEPIVLTISRDDTPPSARLWPPSRGVPIYLFDSAFRL